MADSVDVTIGVSVEIWSPGRQLLPLRDETVYEVAKQRPGVVTRFLEVETLRLHQHRQDVVSFQTFRLLHVVAKDILIGEGVSWRIRDRAGMTKAYVGPTHEVATPVLEIFERRVLDHLVGEIDVQGIFEQGEASVNRAVVPPKLLVRDRVEDLPLYPVLGLLPNGVDVVSAGLVEPALAIGFGGLMQTGSKSGRRQVINMSRR